MKFEIDMTLKFVSEGNHISRATYYEANHLIIEDGIQGDTLLDIVMEKLFPEFRIFEDWDEDVLANGRVILLEEGRRSKEGFCLLYCDGSIAIVTEYGSDVAIRYIGNSSMMGNRMDNLHCVKPKVNNWFTALTANI